MTNVILCGGNGTRLWPISRTLMPKQFVRLFDGRSLFQLTYARNKNLCDNFVIVSNEQQYFLALDQLIEEGADFSRIRFLLEPCAKNTAPAITLACLALEADDVVLVTPSDHLIKDEAQYTTCVHTASKHAQKGYLATFGIRPSYAETGYGYIKADGDVVQQFTEKPDFTTASAYVSAGNYYWNSGMFCFTAGVLLGAMRVHSSSIYEACQHAYSQAMRTKDGHIKIGLSEMSVIDENSIDYAVMEKSDAVKMVASDIGWSDLGSFDSLYDESTKDVNGNVSDKNHLAINSSRCLVRAANNKVVSTVDVDDLVIVDTPDALLVAKRGSTQKVKEIVGRLKKENDELCTVHVTAHRPWGTYTVLEDNAGYKIKKITVKPHKKLSLQKHFHRNEHWIVVSGTALVTVGEKQTLLRPNESTYIKMGDIHRLENPGKIPLVLIEAQVGEYTGEDDIVRIEDDFQRR